MLMQLFKIANGPWENLFSGTFQGHEVELYTNPDRILMVLVYEKKLDRVEGAIVELYKAFHATGDVEAFVDTLPRDVLILTKHDEKSTAKFLLLGSKPTYVRWVETEFIKEIDSLVKRLSTSSKMISDVSKAYELTLQEIEKTTPEIQSAFFAQPMLVPILSTSKHTMQGETPQEVDLKAITKGDIILGLTRDKKKVVEPIALFTKTIVSEGEVKDRDRILQVLAESSLLSEIPVIIFDIDGNFSGIGEASKETEDLQKYQVELDSLGFPLKTYKPKENAYINLNLLSPQAVAELFGVGDKDFPRILGAFLGETKATDIDNLVEEISKMQKTEEFSEFGIHKTARIVKLIGVRYPKLFGGANEIDVMTKKSTSNIGRVSIIDLSDTDPRSALLLIHSILRGIDTTKKESGKIIASVIIPNAELIQGKEKQTIISSEI